MQSGENVHKTIAFKIEKNKGLYKHQQDVVFFY